MEHLAARIALWTGVAIGASLCVWMVVAADSDGPPPRGGNGAVAAERAAPSRPLGSAAHAAADAVGVGPDRAAVVPEGAGERTRPSGIAIAALDPKDQRLLDRVQGVLADGGKRAIPSQATILAEDLPAFRAIVEASNAAFDAANAQWLQLADAVLADAAKDLQQRIDAGETAGLPLMTPDNSLQRRNPREAVAQLSHGGRDYVVRAEDPRVEEAGKACREAAARRLAAFDTRLRALFAVAGGPR